MLAPDKIQPQAFDASIFRSYDIRGIAATQLSEEFAFAVGYIYACKISQQNQQSLIVGRDGRLSSPKLHKALIAGIHHAAINTIDIGITTTPLVSYACQQATKSTDIKAVSGIMITASHNPAQYNGFKFVLNGGIFNELHSIYRSMQQLFPLIDSNAQDRSILLNDTGLTTEPQQQTIDVTEQYFAKICDDIHLPNPVKVVIDGSNGPAGRLAMELYQRLGCQVSAINIEVDGCFPGHSPDTGDPHNLQALCATVIAEQADIGFIYDGDGDRFVAVSGDGQIIWPDQLLMLMSEDLLRNKPGAEVIYDVKCSSQLPKIIVQQGGIATMVRTGRAHLYKQLMNSEAQLAGEFSGHFFYRDRYPGIDDAIYASCRLLEGCQQLGLSLQQRCQKLPTSFNTPEILYAVDDDKKFGLIEKLQALIIANEGQRCTIDGLRIDYVGGWGLVRASNTSAAITLRFEADNPERLATIQNQLMQQIIPIAAMMGIHLAPTT